MEITEKIEGRECPCCGSVGQQIKLGTAKAGSAMQSLGIGSFGKNPALHFDMQSGVFGAYFLDRFDIDEVTVTALSVW